MSLALYRAVTAAGGPLIRGYLDRRRRAGKEDPERYRERLGEPSRPRPHGPLVWIHAASVGESLSILPLVERLRAERPPLNLLVTTGTVASARLIAGRLAAGAIHQYVPVDRVPWVRRFLDHWRPDLALWVESEFWPNALAELAARRVPAVLLNARISARSFAGWRRAPWLIRRLLATFSLALAQSEDDARRLAALGAANVASPGNLKYAAAPLPADAAALAALRAAVGGRPVWLAASTHPGEEAIVADAADRVRASLPDALAVVAPRHPARGTEIAALLAPHGAVARRAAGEAIAPETAFYVADTMGELGLFYRLATVAFVGGSLVPHGGQNVLEPARLGAAVVHGPHMANFAAVAHELSAAGGAIAVGDAPSLADTVTRLLTDADERRRRAAAAQAIADGKDGLLDAVMARLAPFLDDLAAPAKRAAGAGA